MRIFILFCTIYIHIECSSVLLPKIIFIDENENEKHESDIAVKVTSSVVLVCKSANTLNTGLIWTKSDFGSDIFLSTNNHISEEANTSTLNIAEIGFHQSGKYKCTVDGIHSKSSSTIRIHVYGILDHTSVFISTRSTVENIHGLIIKRNLPTYTKNPRVTCKFQVGRNAVNFASVRWTGNGYNKFPKSFIIDEYLDAETGVIDSGLTMKIAGNSLNRELFGNYTCRLHIVSGSCLQQNVSFSITPVIHRIESADKAYVGRPYSVTCTVVVFPFVIKNGGISWRRNDHEIVIKGNEVSIDDYDHRGRIYFSSRITSHDTLNFKAVEMGDKAVYTCHVKTMTGNDTSGLFLRVKSMKSAIWPMIGILIEFAVLIVIILIYERNRRHIKEKRDPENIPIFRKSERNTHNEDIGVRHR